LHSIFAVSKRISRNASEFRGPHPILAVRKRFSQSGNRFHSLGGRFGRPSQPIEFGPCFFTRSRVSINLIAGIPQKGGKAMSTKKQPTIKAATGFRRMNPDAVYSAANAIYTGLNGNTNIPAPPPPFDLPALLAANQSLSAANSAALDGGTKAVSQRNHHKEVVVKLLDQLAKYVEANCKEDMTIFLSSGFKAKSFTKATPATASESIRYVKPGSSSGQAQAKLVAVPGASSYELRWAPVPAGGVPGAWISQPVTNIRSATVVTGLTPGTTYAFQARAVIQSAYTDWSDSVTLMAT
jgi:hypothetical protein